jgi:hypothetical protein
MLAIPSTEASCHTDLQKQRAAGATPGCCPAAPLSTLKHRQDASQLSLPAKVSDFRALSTCKLPGATIFWWFCRLFRSRESGSIRYFADWAFGLEIHR